MADESDQDSKTEAATPKRIEDALKRGNTPFSREVGTASVILAIGLSTPFATSYIASRLSPGLALFLDSPGVFRIETAQDVVSVFSLAQTIAIQSIWPILLGLIVVGVLAAGVQNRPRLVLHRIAPDASRISIAKGWKRIAGAVGLVEFGKALAKIGLFCAIMYVAMRASVERLLGYNLTDATALPGILAGEIGVLFLLTGIVLVAIAAADVLWTRLKWHLDLRMSHQEIKEEHKQSEGDPIVRARQRSVARERARRRMISSIPRATLVVANPTHYAVALRYVHGESTVPIVVAKGIEHLALRIREIAEQHDIPVIEDRALAKSLYAAVKADLPIPPEFYRAVAEIIMFLMTQRGDRALAYRALATS